MIRFNQTGPHHPLVVDPDAASPGLVLRLPADFVVDPLSADVLDMGIILELPAGLVACLTPAPEMLAAGVAAEAGTVIMEPAETRNGISYGVFNPGEAPVTLSAEMPIVHVYFLQVAIPVLIDDPRLKPLIHDEHEETPDNSLFGESFN